MRYSLPLHNGAYPNQNQNSSQTGIRTIPTAALGGGTLFLSTVAMCAQLATSETFEGVFGPPAAAPPDGINSELVTTRPTAVFETPAAVTILSHEDIRRSGATTIPDLLRLVPGLDVIEFGSSAWTVSSRGFTDATLDNIQLMFDGRRANDPFGAVFWDIQDTLLEEVDHIEILRGPTAAAMAPDSLNGVVNVVTKSAKDSQGVLITGGGGTLDRGFAGVRYGGKISDTAFYKIYAKYFYRDSVVTEQGKRIGDDWQMGRVGFRLDWEPQLGNELLFEGELFGLLEGRGATDDRTAPPVFHDDTEHVSGGNLLSRWTRTLSENSQLKLQASYERGHRDVPFSQRYDFDTGNVDFSHLLSLGNRNDLVWGVSYRVTADRTATDRDVAFDPHARTTQLYGLFAYDTITLIEDTLKLALGSRLEHNDFTEFEVEPNARLAWTLTKQQTLWASVGRSVLTPSRYDTAVDDHSFAGDLFGASHFEAEDVVAYELGYRIQPCARASFDVAGFYNDYSDLRTTEALPAIPPLAPTTYGNNLFGEGYGVELAGNLRLLDEWRVRAGYTYTEGFFHTKSHSTDAASEGVAERMTPQNQFFVHSSTDLPAGVTFDAVGRYVDHTAFAPSYCVADLRLGWSPCRNAELAVVGRNIFETRHTENADYIENSIFGKLTVQF